MDNTNIQVDTPSGSTVQQAIEKANISLDELDKIDPSLSSQVIQGSHIKIVRVTEEFYTQQTSLPFPYQELKNEALPEGEKHISQLGVNGVEEVTYKRIFHDGLEVSNSIVKTIILKEAIPEVVMVGNLPMSAAVYLPGKLAYLSAGNAWLLETTTANRQLVVSSGDLDGRVFSLSRNGSYLLFTRYSTDKNSINDLGVAFLNENPVKIIDLGIKNIIHYAEFNQETSAIAYSTAEWRAATPGWQANNDLFIANLQSDVFTEPYGLVNPNTGGIYGWWGDNFSWSPDALSFLVARPDGIGIINARDGTQISLMTIDPYQTDSDWAWVPGAAWSPDSKVIFFVNHTSTEVGGIRLPRFDLVALPVLGGYVLPIAANVGMFAYPSPSPITHINQYIDPVSGENLTQTSYSIAYLQADFPDKSETSKYSLHIIDRDGSNAHRLFPAETANGLEPQQMVWSPEIMGGEQNYAIALIYNGNIWIIDSGTGVAQQITTDGLAERITWR